MLPAGFDYVRPSTLPEAVADPVATWRRRKATGRWPEPDPPIELRFAFPHVLIDIGRLQTWIICGSTAPTF